MAYNRVYLKENVFDAALNRVRWVYDNFKHVVVSFSGGKDSTVVLNLALRVAEEKGRLPVPVLWIDQEAEWSSVVQYIRTVMYDPRVRPAWLQVPFKLFNATSADDPWLQCWDPKVPDRWVHPQDPISVKRNVYGTDRFKPLFTKWADYHYATSPVANLAGIRCEESPGRTLALSSGPIGRGYPITWGWAQNASKKHFVVCPVYDWGYKDVWKAIHQEKWPYCSIYDTLWQKGLKAQAMRVSSLHHVQALRTLHYLQEVEHDTWERVQARVHGIHACAQMKFNFHWVEELPPMFSDWREYRDYLLPLLITDALAHSKFLKIFTRYDRLYTGSPPKMLQAMYQYEVGTILHNDWHGVYMGQWASTHRPPHLLARWAREDAATAAKRVLVTAGGEEVEAEDDDDDFGGDDDG